MKTKILQHIMCEERLYPKRTKHIPAVGHSQEEIGMGGNDREGHWRSDKLLK
jgi:hypothetical protein